MRLVRYVLVLVVALELTLLESFFVAARPFGWPLPLAAGAAVIGNVLMGVWGSRTVPGPAGAAGPGLVWLAVALVMGSKRAEGDIIVPGTGRGVAFLVAGAAAAAGVVAVTSAGKKNTSPEGDTRR